MIYKRRQCISVSESPPPDGGLSITSAAGFKVLTRRSNPLSASSILTGKPSDGRLRIRAADAVCQVLRQYCHGSRILCAGIGNPAVTPDSLGPRCIANLIASPDTTPALFTLTPDVPARTGLDTASLIRAAADLAQADCIITVDALAARSESSLASLIQITDHGTAPGSGTSESVSSAITSQTMGIPVISVGVPTVIESGDLLVTPADCDFITDLFAKILSRGILCALFRSGNCLPQREIPPEADIESL